MMIPELSTSIQKLYLILCDYQSKMMLLLVLLNEICRGIGIKFRNTT